MELEAEEEMMERVRRSKQTVLEWRQLLGEFDAWLMSRWNGGMERLGGAVDVTWYVTMQDAIASLFSNWGMVNAIICLNTRNAPRNLMYTEEQRRMVSEIVSVCAGLLDGEELSQWHERLDYVCYHHWSLFTYFEYSVQRRGARASDDDYCDRLDRAIGMPRAEYAKICNGACNRNLFLERIMGFRQMEGLR